MNWKKLGLSLVITFAAAATGSLATFQSIPNWYVTLEKTVITPPNWVFGPAWTLLYILMAIAFYLVWKSQSKNPYIRTGIILFIVQLFLNALWSIVFFGLHQILLAFFEIIALLIAILSTMYAFSKVSKTALYLMIPYVLWVTFAMVLNYFTYLANR